MQTSTWNDEERHEQAPTHPPCFFWTGYTWIWISPFHPFFMRRMIDSSHKSLLSTFSSSRLSTLASLSACRLAIYRQFTAQQTTGKLRPISPPISVLIIACQLVFFRIAAHGVWKESGRDVGKPYAPSLHLISPTWCIISFPCITHFRLAAWSLFYAMTLFTKRGEVGYNCKGNFVDLEPCWLF